MNEEKIKEIINEVADFFERRKNEIESVRDYSIRNIQSRMENSPNVEPSKIMDETRGVEERYNNQLQELENTRNAFFNIESKIDELKNKLNEHSKIHKLMEEIKSNLTNDNEVNSALNKMFKVYDEEYGSIYTKYFNEYKEVLENAKNVASKNRYINEHVDDSNSPTLKMLIDRMEKFYVSLFSLGTRLEEKTEDRLMTDSEEKLNVIEEYEKEVKQGHIFPLTKEVSTSSFFRRNKIRNIDIDTGKTVLLNIIKIELRIKNMNEILKIMKMRQNDYSKTYAMILAQLDKEQKLLKIAKEKFEKSDFNLIEMAIKNQEKKEGKYSAMQKCAEIYAKIESLLDKHPQDKNQIAFLQSQFEQFAKEGNLSENDVRIAQLNGKELYSEKRHSEVYEKAEIRAEKWKKDKELEEQIKKEEGLREEVIKEMAGQGWRHEGPTILKNGDTDLVEETKLWEAEVERIVKERLLKKDISHLTESLTHKLEKEKTPLDLRLEMDKLKQDINSSVISRLELDTNGVISSEEKDEKIKYYMSTIDKDRKERALETLKKEGFIPQNATFGSLNKMQQDALAAQMRIESGISDAIEQFKAAKDEYDKFVLAERQEKLNDLNSNKGRHK